MAILPVLDLMNGQIVRGIAGRRDEYRPVISKLVDSAAPLAVAQALRAHFGFSEFYLADLDAIQQGRLAVRVYRQLREAGMRLWIDAGLRTAEDAAIDELMANDAAGVIIGLESVAGPETLRDIAERVGLDRAVFSLDLKAGQPLGNVGKWPAADSWSIAAHAITTLAIRRLIVLDLARVGVGAGVGTEDLCARLKHAFPHLELTAGGGVRGIDDVRRLTACGVDRVLVASALHDGRIKPHDVP